MQPMWLLCKKELKRFRTSFIIRKKKRIFFPSIKIQTVDSFQGDEKDILILSTVRCNGDENIRIFDSNRPNVALIRARNVNFILFCWQRNCLWILSKFILPLHFSLNYFSCKKHLWILRHEATLIKSNLIWPELVQDANNCSCFFDTRTALDFAKAIDDFKSMQIKIRYRWQPSRCCNAKKFRYKSEQVFQSISIPRVASSCWGITCGAKKFQMHNSQLKFQ